MRLCLSFALTVLSAVGNRRLLRDDFPLVVRREFTFLRRQRKYHRHRRRGGQSQCVAWRRVGSATVANGGPTFNSNTIPGTNSVAGQFGEALTLNGFNNAAGGGGQFLMFPNLTELMFAAGAPNYTVSYWLKTTTTNQHQFTIMSDWGNAANNPGRFTYGYGINFTSGVAQMRAQSRNNTTGSGNGTGYFCSRCKYGDTE